MRATITLSIALLSALVLLSACSRNSDSAHTSEPAETADQCVARVKAQYEHTSQAGPAQSSDAYETAVLLCKF